MSGQTITDPLVSVGIPVYNGANYLAEAIQSIRDQTFEEFELIISDNASTDDTEAICRRAAERDSRVRYVRHQSNRGAAANYNHTVDLARGSLFTWLAHDDLRRPEFLRRAVEALAEQPESVCAFSRTVQVGPDGANKHVLPRLDDLLSDQPSKRFRAAFVSRYPEVVVFGLLRKSALDRTGRHGAFRGADRVLAAELALLGPFTEMEGELMVNRDHPDRYVRLPTGYDPSGWSAQEAWLDPGRGHGYKFSRWIMFRRLVAAAMGAPLAPAERARCLAAVASSLGARRGLFAKRLVAELLGSAAYQLRKLHQRYG